MSIFSEMVSARSLIPNSRLPARAQAWRPAGLAAPPDGQDQATVPAALTAALSATPTAEP